MNLIQNSNVLLFAANLFGYEIEIKSKMEQMGATVDYFDERPSNSFLSKALIRINRNFLGKEIEKYYDNIIKKTEGKEYDYIIFIKGESVSKSILSKMKKIHPHAQMILYLWDSIKNNKNALNNIEKFDKILSFDKNDVKKYGFIFRPLFYIDNYKEIAHQKPSSYYDVLFVGTVHSDRYFYVKEIEKQINEYGKQIYVYFFFRSVILYFRKKLFDKTYKNVRKKDFHFSSIPKKELINLVSKSKSLLDAQHPNQTGLTMRTIEALGAKRKLITTNAEIKEYDFYKCENILVVDRKVPIINKEFFETPYIEIEDEIYKKYSIEAWVNDIIK